MYSNYIIHMSSTDIGKLLFKKKDYNKREKWWFLALMLTNFAYVILYYHTYIIFFFELKDRETTKMLAMVDLVLHYAIFLSVSIRYVYILKHREHEQMR